MKALEKQVASLAKQNESLSKKFDEFGNKMEKKCESLENKLTLLRRPSEDKKKWIFENEGKYYLWHL